MTMTRRTLAVALSVITAMGLSGVARAESDDAAAVKGALEALRQAMLAGDKVKLASLTADQLSYGHSSGKLETKTEFIGCWHVFSVRREVSDGQRSKCIPTLHWHIWGRHLVVEYAPYAYRWQATRLPSTCVSFGACSPQRGMAWGQRG
jgi:hypothetical protein